MPLVRSTSRPSPLALELCVSTQLDLMHTSGPRKHAPRAAGTLLGRCRHHVSYRFGTSDSEQASQRDYSCSRWFCPRISTAQSVWLRCSGQTSQGPLSAGLGQFSFVCGMGATVDLMGKFLTFPECLELRVLRETDAAIPDQNSKMCVGMVPVNTQLASDVFLVTNTPL